MKTMNVGLIAGWLLMVSAANAADVDITIIGRVVAKPCTVSTTTTTVTLGDLYTFDFVSAGAASAWHDVTLSLTACPVGTSKVTATFTGTADSTGYYKNQGTAKNIQLQLQDSSGNTLNTGAKRNVPVSDATYSADFPLRVRALSVNGQATQGSINAVINVTYTYS